MKMVDERHRLGIDLDNIPIYKLYEYYFNLKHAFPDKKIIVYRTRKGYHIILPDVKTDLKAREIFGDDLWRIKFEEARCEAFKKEPEDILFYNKRIIRNGRVISDFTREECDILKEPFCNTHVNIKRC